VEPRSALINRIRGLLSELGIVLPLKAATEVGAAGGFEASKFTVECFTIYSFLCRYYLG
jgi:hypothetical protein